MKKVNLSSLEYARDDEHPEGYKVGMAPFRASIGAFPSSDYCQDDVMVRRESHVEYFDRES